MGWKSLSNGAMLDKADGAGFALLITGDTTMAQEQNMRRRSIQILVIDRKRPMDDAHKADLRREVDRYLR